MIFIKCIILYFVCLQTKKERMIALLLLSKSSWVPFLLKYSLQRSTYFKRAKVKLSQIHSNLWFILFSSRFLLIQNNLWGQIIYLDTKEEKTLSLLAVILSSLNNKSGTYIQFLFLIIKHLEFQSRRRFKFFF